MNEYQNSAYLKAVRRAKRAEQVQFATALLAGALGGLVVWLMVVLYTV